MVDSLDCCAEHMLKGLAQWLGSRYPSTSCQPVPYEPYSVHHRVTLSITA
jgi:hypothetical protein